MRRRDREEGQAAAASLSLSLPFIAPSRREPLPFCAQVNLGEHVLRALFAKYPRQEIEAEDGDDEETEVGETAIPMTHPGLLHDRLNFSRLIWELWDVVQEEAYIKNLPPPYEYSGELPVLVKTQDGRVLLHKKVTLVRRPALPA